MRYIKKTLSVIIQCYQENRYTLFDCINQINREINNNTWCIPQKEEREQQQQKLYRYALSKLLKVMPD